MSNTDKNSIMMEIDSYIPQLNQEFDHDEFATEDCDIEVKLASIDSLCSQATKKIKNPFFTLSKEHIRWISQAIQTLHQEIQDAENSFQSLSLLQRLKRMNLGEKSSLSSLAEKHKALGELVHAVYKRVIRTNQDKANPTEHENEIGGLKKIYAELTLKEIIRSIQEAKDEQNSYPDCSVAIFYTKTEKFQVRLVDRQKALEDPSFFEAKKLTLQKLKQLMGLSTEETLVHTLSSLLRSMDLMLLGDHLELIKKTLVSAHELLNDTISREKETYELVRSFTHIQELINLYEQYSSRIRSNADWYNSNAHVWQKDYLMFKHLIHTATHLQERARRKLPNISFFPLSQYQFDSALERGLKDPIQNVSMRFLEPKDLILSDYFASSERIDQEFYDNLAKNEPLIYFESVVSELSALKNLDEISLSLRKKLIGLSFVYYESLISLPCIQGKKENIEKILILCPKLTHIRADVRNDEDLAPLKQILSRAVSLKKIEILGDNPGIDHVLEAIPSNNSLEELICSSHFFLGKCLEKDSFRNLKKLYVGGSVKITDEILRGISSTHLEVLECSLLEITGECLSSDHFAHVKELRLNNCTKITDHYLKKISSVSLETFECQCTHIKGSCFSKEAFKNLKSLDIQGCIWVTDEMLQKASFGGLEALDCQNTLINGSSFSTAVFKNLKELIVRRCNNIKDIYLAKLSSRVLEKFDCYGTEITGTCFSSEAFKALRSLNISLCKNITDLSLRALSSTDLETLNCYITSLVGSFLSSKAFNKLKLLDLHASPNLTDEGLASLSSERLEILDVSVTNITGKCLAHPTLKNLRRLNLWGCRNLNDDGLRLLPSTQLEDICCRCTPITGSCLSADAFKTVTSLNLYGCRDLKDAELAKLSSKKLQYINCTYAQITGSCLSAESFKTVKTVILSSCRYLIDTFLGNISSSELEILDCSNTPISGRCFSQPVFRNLRSLNVSECFSLLPKALQIFERSQTIVKRDPPKI